MSDETFEQAVRDYGSTVYRVACHAVGNRTDALAQNGEYRFEGDSFEVVVDENGVGVVTAYGLDGTEVSYSTEQADGQNVNYTVYDITTETEGETSAFQVEGADSGESVKMEEYEIITDPSGTVAIREK